MVDYSSRNHPYRTSERLDLWDFCYKAYKGGDPFIDFALVRHPMEDADDFLVRKKRAFYLNFVKRIVNTMTDIIFDNIIVRPDTETFPVLAPFYRRASYFGETFDKFIRRCSKLSSVFGWVIITVDFFSESSPSIADVEAGRAYPKLRMFNPLEVIDWSRRGEKFNFLLIKREVYYRPNSKSEITKTDEYIVYDENTVEIVRDNKIVNVYTHNLGYAPVVLLNDSIVDEFGFSDPLISDIVYMAKALVNWCSVLDEVFAKQALSQLAFPDDGSLYEEAAKVAENILDQTIIDGDISSLEVKDYTWHVLKKVGSAKIFTFPSNTGHPPLYISPPAGELRTAWEIIMSLAPLMFFLVGLGSLREDAFTNSSKAREMAMSITSSYLKDKASNLQLAEENIFNIYFDYMPEIVKPENSIYVSYPAEIDAGSYIDYFKNVVDSLISRNISPTFNKSILYRLIDACPYISQSQKEIIKKEIKSSPGNYQVNSKISQ